MHTKPSEKKRPSHHLTHGRKLSASAAGLPPPAATMNFFVDWPGGTHRASVERRGSSRDKDKEKDKDKGKERERERGVHLASMAATADSASSSGTGSSGSASTTGTSVSMYASDDGGYFGPYSGLPATGFPGPGNFYTTWVSQMHTLLEGNSTPLIWDVRLSPTELTATRSASRLFGPNALSFPVLSNGAGHMRIISKDFPWSLELGPKSRALTACEVLHQLYDLLQKPLDDALWGAADDKQRELLERAAKKRDEHFDKIKNVDWLGKKCMFRGFLRDDKFAAKRLMLGSKEILETWVVIFAKP